MDDLVSKVDKTYADFIHFIDSCEYEYAAMLTRTIVEIIVKSYIDHYLPEMNNANPPPTIMDQIKALDKANYLPHNTIYNLHEMRKLGNIGSHQDKGSGDLGIIVKSTASIIELEISNWKSFINNETIPIESNKGIVKSNPVNLISLIVSIIGAAVIIVFSINTTISYFRDNYYFDDSHLGQYWLCLIGFFILAFFCCRYGKINKIIFTTLDLYFLAPRIYMVIYSLTHENGTLEFIVNIFLSAIIIAVYSVIISVTEAKTGGIEGYKGQLKH